MAVKIPGSCLFVLKSARRLQWSKIIRYELGEPDDAR